MFYSICTKWNDTAKSSVNGLPSDLRVNDKIRFTEGINVEWFINGRLAHQQVFHCNHHNNTYANMFTLHLLSIDS